MSDGKSSWQELVSSLKQERDEIALKVHLASAEVKQEWGKVEEKWNTFWESSKPVKDAAVDTAGNVSSALKLAAEELKKGFRNIREKL